MSYFQLHLAEAFCNMGFNVVTFDWRGFGTSSYFPMDKNYLCYTEMLEDYNAVINTVAQQPEVRKRCYCYYGVVKREHTYQDNRVITHNMLVLL
jgi:alpha-beta hydrolase superfamily lysophospholipase